MSKQFKIAGIVGMFDRLHDGHKFLIRQALEYADTVNCFIFDKSTAHIPKAALDELQPYEERIQKVKDYVKEIGASDRFNFYVDLKDEEDAMQFGAKNAQPDVILFATKDRIKCITTLLTRGKEIIKAVTGKMPKCIFIPTIKDEHGKNLASSRERIYEVEGRNKFIPK